MRDRIHDLARRVHDLPTLPAIYQQVEAATRDPATSAAQLAQIIGKDPVFAARLLRVVNSARYALADRVTTVTRAVSILGHKAVRETILVTSVLAILPQQKERRWLGELFWRHALAVGSAAQVLGAAANPGLREEFFVAGLLHDIGKLFWLRYFPDELVSMVESAQASNLTFLESEAAMTGTSHVRLGRMLARHWRLPEEYQDAIGFHHEVSPVCGNAQVCFAVQIGDLIVHALELDGPLPIRLPAVQPEAWQSVRVEPEALPVLIDAVQAEFQDNLELFPLFLSGSAADASTASAESPQLAGANTVPPGQRSGI